MWLYNAVKLEYCTAGQDNHIQQQKTTTTLPFFITTIFHSAAILQHQVTVMA
jgi:hypothetical protein